MDQVHGAYCTVFWDGQGRKAQWEHEEANGEEAIMHDSNFPKTELEIQYQLQLAKGKSRKLTPGGRSELELNQE